MAPTNQTTNVQEAVATTARPTMTVTEAAEMLGIGRSTAYEAIRDGTIPSLRFRRRIVVPRAAIERMLE